MTGMVIMAGIQTTNSELVKAGQVYQSIAMDERASSGFQLMAMAVRPLESTGVPRAALLFMGTMEGWNEKEDERKK